MNFLFSIILFFCLVVPAHSKPVIEDFLNKVKASSVNYKIISLESSAIQLNNELELSQFDLTANIKGEYYNSKDVSISPFAPESTENKTYSLGVGKKWSYGFETGLSYELADSSTTFASQGSNDFFIPDINLNFKTNLVQDLIYGKSRSVKNKVNKLTEAEKVSQRLQQKDILRKSLVVLTEILEKKEEVFLQANLCAQIKKQVSKLRQKSKIGSVPKRDYLLSLKNKNDCESAKRSLDSVLNQKKQVLNDTYGVGVDYTESVKLEELFDEIVILYTEKSNSSTEVNFKEKDSILLYEKQIQASISEAKALKAQTKAPLAFEMKFGLKGQSDKLSDAHEDVLEMTNPYVLGSLELKLPFSNREASSKLKVNKWQQEILQRKIDLESSTAKSNFQLLGDNISVNLKNYEARLSNVKLSKSVLKEAQRDFNIGRIDFLTLSEFQKSLIQSQKQLGLVRISTTVLVLNYLDYYQYFNRYFNL